MNNCPREGGAKDITACTRDTCECAHVNRAERMPCLTPPSAERCQSDHSWEDQQAEEIRGLRAAIGALLPYAEERTTSATAAAARRFALAMLAATRSPE